MVAHSRLVVVIISGLFMATVPASSAEQAGRSSSTVPHAMNLLGLDLLRMQARNAPEDNHLLSPYSIEAALAMAYAGAAGATRDEMQRVLHLSTDAKRTALDFTELTRALDELQLESTTQAAEARDRGEDVDAITLNVANRLFVQSGLELKKDFRRLLNNEFLAPLEELEFRHAPEHARVEINSWVSEKTRNRIQDLLPEGTLDASTRMVLANAVYLKAPWAEPFPSGSTKPADFWLGAKRHVQVPMMTRRDKLGYADRGNYVAIALPYLEGKLHFVVLLPKERDGLAELERTITGPDLATSAALDPRDVVVHLPKFKLEPPVLMLKDALLELGMESAFDVPPGSANFERMVQQPAKDPLAIAQVAHRTWLSVDEEGTEAAVASAVTMALLSAPSKPPPKPIEVRIDHPFLFAIQHIPSGACLFLGRVADPR